MESAPSVAPRYCRRCQIPLAAWAPGSTCPACMMASSASFGTASLHVPEPAGIPVENGVVEQPLVFGDYLLEKQINHGGMGVVYRARQLSLNRIVAVKLLLLGRYSSDESRLRFRREAQSAARLRHPNIVAVYEVGECDDQPFIAMEFVDGGSLADRLREGPLPARDAAELIRIVAGAIEYAHQQGVMHRDVKPSNLLVAANGGVHVTDFGLAKQIDGTSDVTLSGRMLGTPNYLPPEAIGGASGSFGATGDVYSLGAVLYETLTGRPPFLSGSLPETLRRIAETEPVALRTLNPAVPRDLETICLKALAKDPARRFATPKALSEELGRWLAGEPVRTRRAGWPERLVKWSRRKPAVAALTALSTLAITATISTLLVSYQRVSSAQVTAERAAADNIRTLIHFMAIESEHLIRQNENHSALLHLGEALRLDPTPSSQMMNRRRITGARLTAPELKGLWLDEEGVNFPRFSPEGDKLAVRSSSKGIGVFDAWTGREITGFPKVSAPEQAKAVEVWLTYQNTVWMLDKSSRLLQLDPRTLLPAGPVVETAVIPENKRCRRGLQFSRGRSRFAAILPQGGAAVFESATGAQVQKTFLPGVPLTGVRVSQNRLVTAVAEAAGGITILNASTSEVKYRLPVPGTVKLLEINSEGTGLLVISVNGDDPDSTPHTVTWYHLGPDGAENLWTRKFGAEIFDARLSPDDRYVSAATAEGEVLLVRTDGRGPNPDLIRQESAVWSLAFSPSGTSMATACEDGTVRVWELDTRTQIWGTMHHGDLITHLEFSPDGLSLLTSGRENIVRLWKLNKDTSDFIIVGSPNYTGTKVFHPDGKLFFTAAGPSILLWNIPRGPSPDPDGDFEHGSSVTRAMFSPGGKWILSGCENGMVHLWDVAARKLVFSQSLAAKHPGRIVRVDFSGDGTMFLAAGSNGTVRRWENAPGFPVTGADWQHAGEVRTAVFSPDSKTVLTAASDKTVVLHDARSGETLLSQSMEWEPSSALFDEAGRRFVVAGWDAEIKARPAQIWDIASKSPAAPPIFQSDGLTGATFNRDGSVIATIGEEKRVMLWEAGTGKYRITLARSRGSATATAFSPRGDMIVTSGGNNTAQVWEVATGDPVTGPLPWATVDNCNWSADGNRLLTSSASEAYLWNLSPAPECMEDLRLEAELLSCQRLEGLFGLLPLTPREIETRWLTLSKNRALSAAVKNG